MSDVHLDRALMRVLANPVRLKVLAVLRQHGPATASGVGRELDIRPGSASYHLRQLAEHGFVVEAPGRGNPREQWWAAAHERTIQEPAKVATEDLDDNAAYAQAVALVAADRVRVAAGEVPFLPEKWARVSTYTDVSLRLTPDQATRMKDEVLAVIERYRTTESSADDAASVVAQFQVMPSP